MDLRAFLFDVTIALLLGAAVGLERQFRRHPAGLRTNALVCLGAALFVSVSRLAGDVNSPTRVASYVVSGVGFLGGGVILREGLNVRGIDTAATLWCSAAVGVLAGSGFPVYAAIGAALVLSLNLILRPVARRIDARARVPGGETGYQIRVVCAWKQRDAVREDLLRQIDAHSGLVLLGLVSRQSKRRKRAGVVADLTAAARDDRTVEAIVARLGFRPGVLSVEWEAATAPQG